MHLNSFFSIVLLVLLFSCTKEKSWKKAVEKGYDIIIIAGQSNTMYGYGYDSSKMIKSNVLEVGRWEKDMQIIQATPSLHNWNRDSSRSGFGYDFARYYSNRNALNKKEVLIIACGEPGSGFVDYR
jgi:hypothetical protein